MASPCEVLCETADAAVAQRATALAAEEAWRIERKFSRYRSDNIVHAINTGAGQALNVDEETARLIDFGATLWRLSDGAFDLTSGALRRVWKFGENAAFPTQTAIDSLL